jgi:hypothetical protein
LIDGEQWVHIGSMKTCNGKGILLPFHWIYLEGVGEVYLLGSLALLVAKTL